MSLSRLREGRLRERTTAMLLLLRSGPFSLITSNNVHAAVNAWQHAQLNLPRRARGVRE